ncbi:BBS2 [Cordylochernes scorpioides]|uniref:BBS2 n=1 Tax=Cordylochernes scorpioides TaxID=51811 RepID=A0ABY6KPZ5_9ARAC|nr:BBS2 [Cordylochernes scorpioides]
MAASDMRNRRHEPLQVRGFSPKSGDQPQDLMGSNFEQDSIHELSLKKQNLLMELRNYEENLRFGNQEDPMKKVGQPNQEFGVIPCSILVGHQGLVQCWARSLVQEVRVVQAMIIMASTQLRTHLEVNLEAETSSSWVHSTVPTVLRTKEASPDPLLEYLEASRQDLRDSIDARRSADCYRAHPQVVDRGMTFRYEGQLRNKQNTLTKKLSQTNSSIVRNLKKTSARVPLQSYGEVTSPHVELVLQTTNNTIIKTVIIFAEGIFTGESHVVHVPEANISNTLKVPLFPPKDMPIDLHVKALIGYPASLHYHVFEVNRPLPKFSMYTLCESAEGLAPPVSHVTFSLPPGASCYKVTDCTACLSSAQLCSLTDLKLSLTEATLDRSNVYRWYKMFSEGREDVNDEERAGRPSTSTTDEKINEVEKMILANR